jgi:hypothetical protein
MPEEYTPLEHKAAKAAVFVSCLVIGGLVAIVVGVLIGSLWGCLVGPVMGFIVAFVNPFIAASAAESAERLEAWSSPDPHQTWTISKRAAIGAAWPVALPYFVIVSCFYWSINKHFPSS